MITKSTQYIAIILNRIAKPFDKICGGLKSMLQRFRTFFCTKSYILRCGNHQLGSRANSNCFKPNLLHCLADGIQALRIKISCKICLESLKYTLQSCISFVEWFCNFIQNQNIFQEFLQFFPPD